MENSLFTLIFYYFKLSPGVCTVVAKISLFLLFLSKDSQFYISFTCSACALVTESPRQYTEIINVLHYKVIQIPRRAVPLLLLVSMFLYPVRLVQWCLSGAANSLITWMINFCRPFMHQRHHQTNTQWESFMIL